MQIRRDLKPSAREVVVDGARCTKSLAQDASYSLVALVIFREHSSRMQVHTYRHPSWLTNTYLIVDDQSQDAILVDAGAPPGFFDAALRTRPFKLHTLLLTHQHHDHIDQLQEWQPLLAIPPISSAQPAQLSFGTFHIRVLATPGHCADHLCFAVESCGLFTGDLLFKGSVGGTRGGSFEELKSSLQQIFREFGPDTPIYPGHSEPTTIGYEREHNPFVRFLEGTQAPLDQPFEHSGRRYRLLVEARDYDGEKKYLVAEQESGNLSVLAP